MSTHKQIMKIKHSEEINLQRWIVPFILRYDTGTSTNDSYQGQFIYVVGDKKNQRRSGLKNIKIVTDGDIIIPAIFTPAAKLKFFNKTKSFVESSMTWNNYIFLIKTCKVEFNNKFRPILLIEEFTFQAKATTVKRLCIKKCSGHIGLLQLSSKLKNKYGQKYFKNVHSMNCKDVLADVNIEFEIEDEIDDFLIPPKTLSILNSIYKSSYENVSVLTSSQNNNLKNKKLDKNSCLPNSFETTETIRDCLNCQHSQESKLSNKDSSNSIHRIGEYLSYSENNLLKEFSGGNKNCLIELKPSATLKKRKITNNCLFAEIKDEILKKKGFLKKKKLLESTERLHDRIIEWRQNSIFEQGVENVEETLNKTSKNESLFVNSSEESTILPSLSDGMESHQLTEDSIDILQNYYLKSTYLKSMDNLTSTPFNFKQPFKETLVKKSSDQNKFSCNSRKMKKESWKSIVKALDSLAQKLDLPEKVNSKEKMESVNNSDSNLTQIDYDSIKGTYTVTKGLSTLLMNNVHKLDVVPVIKNCKDSGKFNIFSHKKNEELKKCVNKVNESPILTEELDFTVKKINSHSLENLNRIDEISSEIYCISIPPYTHANKPENTESSSVSLINYPDELSKRSQSSGNDVIFLEKVKAENFTTIKIKSNASDIVDIHSTFGNDKLQTVSAEAYNYSFSNSLPSYQIPGWHKLVFPETTQTNKSLNVSSPHLPSLPKDAFFPTPKRLKIKEARAKKTKMYYNIRKKLINMDLSQDLMKILNDVQNNFNES